MTLQARGICKDCGEDFYTDSENYGTDESLCYECWEKRGAEREKCPHCDNSPCLGQFDSTDPETKEEERVNTTEFRKELLKIMPGYIWTVHRRFTDTNYLAATGIQTAGFNRLSTLEVIKREKEGRVEYEVKSSGFGKKAPWLSENTDGTLARALRGLQDHYEAMAVLYSSCAGRLQYGRKQTDQKKPA